MAGRDRHDGRPAGRRTRRTWYGALAAAAGVAAALAMVETGFRMLGVAPRRMAQRDVNRGTARIPNIALIYTDEGFSHVTINSAGFRDDEWTATKPVHTVRVAVLGDSYVEALQVEERDRFSEIAERLLNGSPDAGGRRVEFLNFGVDGYGTAQELLTLRHHVWAYSPDLVVLVVTPTNDLRNNLETLEQDDGRPYFRLVGDELVLDDSFRTSSATRSGWFVAFARWVADHSRVASVGEKALKLWRARAARARQIERTATASGFEDEAGLDVWIYDEPRNESTREAWRVTEALLAHMYEEVRARGADLLVMVGTSGRQVDPDVAARARFASRLAVPDLLYADRRITETGRRVGFSVLSLAPAFQRRTEEQGRALHGFAGESRGHWNAEGHRLAGELLAEWVATMWRQAAPGVAVTSAR